MTKNKLIAILGSSIVLILIIVFWVVNQPTSVSEIPKQRAFSVGLAISGKLGDKSYNDLTYNGFMRAAKELGLATTVVEPAESAEVRLILSKLARDGVELIVGIGFTARQPITDLAQKYPNTNFLLVDDVIDPPLPNVRSVHFREQEAGFLAGVVAALMTETGKVGVVAGIDLPVVRRYVNGYKDGVRYINPSGIVLINFAGSFSDPAKGKQLSHGLYSAGADVLLNGAGQTGNGIFAAAKIDKKYAIGVDLDQSNQAPENILTSVLKRVDVAIYTAVKDAINNKFESGTASLGVSDGAIDLAPLNENIVPLTVRKKVNDVIVAIKRGDIKVVANYEAP